MEATMTQKSDAKFDPAAHDKHAVDVDEAAKADRKVHSDLEAGLIGSFPASDPASSVQTSPSKIDGTKDGGREDATLLDKIRDAFR
jgi:hypothetical protein